MRVLLLLVVFLSGSALASNTDHPAAHKNPSPDLAPEEVIRQQINALSADGEVKDRVKRCYRFASPANRRFTGPLDKIEQMIQSPEYRVLLDARKYLVGRAVDETPDLDHLMLTVVDKDGNQVCFRCFLTKQAASPCEGCWMTDAVVRVGGIPQDNREKNRSPRSNETI